MVYLILLVIIAIILLGHKKGIPIFLYHNVLPDSAMTPELFEKQLEILKKNRMNTIKISELLLENKPSNSALITLDDGYKNNYEYVFPLLKKYNMKATIFLNTKYVNTLNYMNWSEIKEMYQSGLVEFQAHSHRHVPAFQDIKLLGVYDKNENNIFDEYLYGEIKEGYPKFRKRGEYSIRAKIIDRKFFDLFQKFYEKKLKGKKKKETIRLGQKFIDENIKKYLEEETLEMAQNRIKEDFEINKNEIESHLGYKISFFCWPWGHKSYWGMDYLKKKYDIKGFVTTKKGTNSYNTNLEQIKRVELRKFSILKFKINLFVTRNIVLGKIYQLIS